ncbi:DUF4238 domain-containing protein [Mesorhizobium sp. AR02]|uniref:DUF4238 domain-containing protein n=1 Tax=Mesorhizobium sp. AR02 TaxID=2865837 RepID=UPI00215FD15F|nr:DUF4238 domain-containing protein [Mesorhizobium sp. AR02]UVK56786.1 DUF4238 domain-containing protein [Mesorhizobium sp. AR02]
MRKDHYVAQTYLKHFVHPGGMLHAYRKSDLKDFPCHPGDICREMGGDIVPDFLSKPEALGEYRKTFEPYWKPSVEALANGHAPADVKFAVSGYMANLMVTTPAATRLFVEGNNRNVIETVRAYQVLNARRGKADPKLQRAIEEVDKGRIAVETYPNFIRAMMARQLTEHAWRIYNAEWIVVKNSTRLEFVTCDNPAAFHDPGPFRGGKPILPRYLPLTPSLCLHVVMDVSMRLDEADFSREPQGSVRFAAIEPRGVERINEAVVQCAEDLIISSGKRNDIEALVAKFASHRVTHEFISIPRPDGFLQAMLMRVTAPE